MDYELSNRYQEKLSEIRVDSWKLAAVGTTLTVLALLILATAVMASIENREVRMAMLSIASFGLLIVAVRYGIYFYFRHKLRLKLAREAMTR